MMIIRKGILKTKNRNKSTSKVKIKYIAQTKLKHGTLFPDPL